MCACERVVTMKISSCVKLYSFISGELRIVRTTGYNILCVCAQLYIEKASLKKAESQINIDFHCSKFHEFQVCKHMWDATILKNK